MIYTTSGAVLGALAGAIVGAVIGAVVGAQTLGSLARLLDRGPGRMT